MGRLAWLLLVVAFVLTGCGGSDERTRESALLAAVAAQNSHPLAAEMPGSLLADMAEEACTELDENDITEFEFLAAVERRATEMGATSRRDIDAFLEVVILLVQGHCGDDYFVVSGS